MIDAEVKSMKFKSVIVLLRSVTMIPIAVGRRVRAKFKNRPPGEPSARVSNSCS
jgi:hypothetical protein